MHDVLYNTHTHERSECVVHSQNLGHTSEAGVYVCVCVYLRIFMHTHEGIWVLLCIFLCIVVHTHSVRSCALWSFARLFV